MLEICEIWWNCKLCEKWLTAKFCDFSDISKSAKIKNFLSKKKKNPPFYYNNKEKKNFLKL